MKKTIIWCDLNAEQDRLKKLLGDKAFSIQGSTPSHLKIEYEQRWRNGERPILISKPSVFGYGMNWQNCHNMIFVGLSDSYEMMYQAIRRCWRFGQTEDVHVHIVISEAEGAVKANIERKEKQAAEMISEMVKFTKDILTKEIHGTINEKIEYNADKEMIIPKWLRSENESIKSIAG